MKFICFVKISNQSIVRFRVLINDEISHVSLQCLFIRLAGQYGSLPSSFSIIHQTQIVTLLVSSIQRIHYNYSYQRSNYYGSTHKSAQITDYEQTILDNPDKIFDYPQSIFPLNASCIFGFVTWILRVLLIFISVDVNITGSDSPFSRINPCYYLYNAE